MGFNPRTTTREGCPSPHLEYEEAVWLKKPCLAFLLDPEYAWPPGRVDPNALSSRSKIGKFRQTVETAHGRRFFTTPDSLAAAVLEPLREEEQKHLSDGEKAKAQIRESYLAWLRGSCESVELLGLDLKESQNVRLGQVYVPAVATGKAESGKPESLREERHTLLLHRLGIPLRPRRPRFRQVHLLPLAGLVGGGRDAPGPSHPRPGRISGNAAGRPARLVSPAVPAAGMGRPRGGPLRQGPLDPRPTGGEPLRLAGPHSSGRA